ncbi:hypothetical protein [Bradyrhizobium sp. SZCCHNR1070]|uniref:hypothetical protein n=1 Tax=Bradyrhizobium sp. SZCCHNR1070 TaxID=3057361 RepID=UPI0029163584|nr:hypothetical protein [Bradyrhizobium sp. SZCCHNR1070]
MQHDQRLRRNALGRCAVPQQRVVRRQQRLVLRDRHGQRRIDCGPARAAGDQLRRPAQHLLEEAPRILQLEQPVLLARRLGIEPQRARRRLGVERGLADRGDAGLAQHIGADDEAFGLQIIQPLRGFVLLGMKGHGHHQFVAGQR